MPALAESWDVSEDGKTYTFQLVEGATFTNGEEFTADDAKFSIERVKTDWTISLKAAMDVVEKVEAVSPTELVVTLEAAEQRLAVPDDHPDRRDVRRDRRRRPGQRPGRHRPVRRQRLGTAATRSC